MLHSIVNRLVALLRLRTRFVLVALTIVAAAAPAPAAATAATAKRTPPPAAVPQGFVGVDIDGPMTLPTAHVDLGHQFDLMVANGVESVRMAFSWAAAQPYASSADVPASRVAPVRKRRRRRADELCRH